MALTKFNNSAVSMESIPNISLVLLIGMIVKDFPLQICKGNRRDFDSGQFAHSDFSAVLWSYIPVLHGHLSSSSVVKHVV